MKDFIIIALGSILVNNFVVSQFLGICPFIGVSKNIDSVIGMGLAVTFVMTLASLVTYILYRFFLFPNFIFLKTILFIIVIAVLVQLVEMVMRKKIPNLYNALGIYLPLITTNCAVLGVAVININKNYNLISSILNGFFGGLGFMFALFLLAVIREKLELSDVPKSLKGVPIAFISAGIIALAFLAFDKTMLEFIK